MIRPDRQDLQGWIAVDRTVQSAPQPIISTLSTEVRRIQQLPDVKERFAELGIDVLQGSPQELLAFTRAEIDRFAKIIRETGIRAE